jgi:hypothetical protein
MDDRKQLHALVDSLPESVLDAAEKYLQALRACENRSSRNSPSFAVASNCGMIQSSTWGLLATRSYFPLSVLCWQCSFGGRHTAGDVGFTKRRCQKSREDNSAMKYSVTSFRFVLLR